MGVLLITISTFLSAFRCSPLCSFPRAPYQVHGHIVGEVNAALTRLMPHKKPVCHNAETQRDGFCQVQPPHTPTRKLMGLITALSPFFILKHEKHFYSVNSRVHSAACRVFASLPGKTSASVPQFNIQHSNERKTTSLAR